MGRGFRWLWTAYAVSTVGSYLAFDAFGLVAILVLHAGPAAVSALAAAGRAAGALAALPLGSWVERRRKRPVMITMDLVRCAALLSVPAAHLLGVLGVAQLVAVTVIMAAAGVASTAAAGAALTSLVARSHLLAANARLEATTWTATALGPPLGGAAVGVFGPLATMLADAVSHLLSAAAVRAIGGTEPPPARPDPVRSRAGELSAGWRYLLADPLLRPLLLNCVLVNALILASAPLMAVLMLGELRFPPWQYGLAFGAPCVGGLVGARLSRPLVARHGPRRVLAVAGALRAGWPVGLAAVGPGGGGVALVIVVQFGLLTCIGVFNPVLATCRLQRTAPHRVARTLAAWSITNQVAIATVTALGGVLAAAVGPRAAVLTAGLLLLLTPLLLPGIRRAGRDGAGGAP